MNNGAWMVEKEVIADIFQWSAYKARDRMMDIGWMANRRQAFMSYRVDVL